MHSRLRHFLHIWLWAVAGLALSGAGWAAEQPDVAELHRQRARAIEQNPTLELQFEGCGPWSNGGGADAVAESPQLQIEAARKAKAENRDYEAAEKYFQLTRQYPDAPQTIAGLLEATDLLLDLGYPSKAGFCMEQVVMREPRGTLEGLDVQVNLFRRIGGAAGFGRRIDLNMTISALEASVGLTLLEAHRLGYNDHTLTWWPASLFVSPADRDPFENDAQRLFEGYDPLALNRQFTAAYWVPGSYNLRPFITAAFDAEYYAEAHLNTMLRYDPMSFNIFSGFFHRGRMRLEDERYGAALADFNHIQVDFNAAQHNRNYPADAVEISVFAQMYSAWTRLLMVPQPWKDMTDDNRARANLAAAESTLNKAALLQWLPVVDALNLQLQSRLAIRYRRMAEFYERNGAASAGEMMRDQLRIRAPRSVEAASMVDLYPWRSADNLSAAPAK